MPREHIVTQIRFKYVTRFLLHFDKILGRKGLVKICNYIGRAFQIMVINEQTKIFVVNSIFKRKDHSRVNNNGNSSKRKCLVKTRSFIGIATNDERVIRIEDIGNKLKTIFKKFSFNGSDMPRVG